MRGSALKPGKISIAAVTAALAFSLAAPVTAEIPSGAPVGAQDFISNGVATTIYGSGSDTTYPMQQQLSAIFNRAPGCILQHPTSSSQTYGMECDSSINAVAGKEPGFGNYDRDIAAEYHFIGSGGGRNHVIGWNEGTLGYKQADYFRSSSITNLKDVRFIAFARDALAPFTFDTVDLAGSATDTPGKSVAELTQVQVSNIYQGVTKCWSSIDKTLSPIYNTSAWAPFSSDSTNTGDFVEATWLTDATDGNYTTSSDAYKACVPIAVYTVPDTSGTRQAWDSLAAGGSGKGQLFLTLVDPFTGSNFTSGERLQRLIPENNATPIANRIDDAGINTDLVTNAIYFYSIGRYTSVLGGFDVNGDPQLSGNSTGKTRFTDRLFNVRKTGAVSTAIATRSNIAATSGGYVFARSLYFGYKYPNQATRNYLDPVNGFLCSTATSSMTDPITSANVRTEIEDTISNAGFIPLPSGAVGGGRGTTNSFCRHVDRSTNADNNDATAPTVGPDGATNVANAKRPIFTLAFNELVSGVTTSTVGIQEYNGSTAVGSPIAATVTCENARQQAIDCLAGTSTTNWDIAPLEFVKKVRIQPTGNLTAGKSYKVFALGINGQNVGIQDRHGLADWPIVDGNPLVDYLSDAYAVAKDAQTAPSVATTVKKGKTITFAKKTSQNNPLTVTSLTAKVCKVTTSGANAVVTGLSTGTCKVRLVNAGTSSYLPLDVTKNITVTK